MTKDDKFKLQDRVRKVDGTGCQGLVKEIRSEARKGKFTEFRDTSSLIKVMWDNGTFSFFSPEAIELVS